MRTPTILPSAICLALAMASIHLPVLPVASADSPTTQPTDEPAVDSPMRLWFIQLTDTDPKVRDQATVELMGIPVADLPKLRQLVVDNQPVSPSQAAALKDIVLQAFLAGQTYASAGENHEDTDASGTGGPYFLGIVWSQNFLGEPEEARLGVSVDERLPGFPSYRFLRRGDMILGVLKYPDRPLLELPNCETHTRQQLIDAISQNLPITQNVVLQVLRDGQTIQVPIKMAPRPMEADAQTPGTINVFNSHRMDLAEKYWRENFAALVEPRIEASNLAEAP